MVLESTESGEYDATERICAKEEKKGLRRVASEPERLDICVTEKTNCREMQRTVDICVENTAEKPQSCKED